MYAADHTKPSAALMIQCGCRVSLARHALHARAAALYERVFDPGTGDVYYHNTRTHDAYWVKPACLGDGRANCPIDYSEDPRFEGAGVPLGDMHHSGGVSGVVLPLEWEEAEDPAHPGKTYYFNTTTDEVRWELPPLHDGWTPIDLSEDGAATRILACARGRLGRRAAAPRSPQAPSATRCVGCCTSTLATIPEIGTSENERQHVACGPLHS